MEYLFVDDIKIKKVSKQRPKSLLIRIPGTVRDIFDLQDETTMKMEVVKDDNEKYIKIKPKTE